MTHDGETFSICLLAILNILFREVYAFIKYALSASVGCIHTHTHIAACRMDMYIFLAILIIVTLNVNMGVKEGEKQPPSLQSQKFI